MQTTGEFYLEFRPHNHTVTSHRILLCMTASLFSTFISMGLRNPWFYQTKVFSYGQQVIRFSYLLPWRMIILHAISPELSRRCFRLLWLICSVMRTRTMDDRPTSLVTNFRPTAFYSSTLFGDSYSDCSTQLPQLTLYSRFFLASKRLAGGTTWLFIFFGLRTAPWGQVFPEWEVKCVNCHLYISCPWTRQLSRDVPADIGFLCDKGFVFRDAMKRALRCWIW